MKKKSLVFALPALMALMVACGGKSPSSKSQESQQSEASQTSESVSESISESESMSESESQTSSETQSQSQSESTSETTSSGTSSTSTTEDKKQTYNFFIDYSHSDAPFYTMMWWNGVPLGEVPPECQLTSEDAPDEAYPVFLGWSKYSSAIDESQLWDFSKDASLNKTVELYGIWVSE